MENQILVPEINEKDLELVVNKKTLGSLTTNAKQIKELVEKALPNYDISNYSEDNIDLAKKDKAMLNNASKALNSKRIEIEKEFMKPFEEFKEIVGETVRLISVCSAKIDAVVKQSVDRYKEEKRGEIQEYFNSKKFELVGMDKIFDQKWLNKTSKIKDIESDIDSKIDNIKDDIKTLEAIGENTELLKSLYLDTLNINSTIQYANTLKENAAKARAEKEKEKEKEGRDFGEEEIGKNPSRILPDIENIEVVEGGDIDQVEVIDNTPESISTQNELLIRTMRVTATRDKIIALGDFMNANGIQFEKLG